MSIASETKDGILSIYFTTPRILDEAQLETVSKDVIAMLGKTTEDKVILDFSKVQFMSSSMLGKLVLIHKKCQEFKVKLKLSGISPDIKQVFKITRLDKLFDIENDEASARKAFVKRGIFG